MTDGILAKNPGAPALKTTSSSARAKRFRPKKAPLESLVGQKANPVGLRRSSYHSFLIKNFFVGCWASYYRY